MEGPRQGNITQSINVVLIGPILLPWINFNSGMDR